MAKEQVQKQEQAQADEPVLERPDQINIRLKEIDTKVAKHDEGLGNAEQELVKFRKNLGEEKDRLAADVDKVLDEFFIESSTKGLLHRILTEPDKTSSMNHLEKSIMKVEKTVGWHKEKKNKLNRERRRLGVERRELRAGEAARGFIDDMLQVLDQVKITQLVHSSALTNLRVLEDVAAEGGGLSPTQRLSKAGAPEWLVILSDTTLDKQRLKTTDFTEFLYRASQAEMGGKNPFFRNHMRSKEFGVTSVYSREQWRVFLQISFYRDS